MPPRWILFQSAGSTAMANQGTFAAAGHCWRVRPFGMFAGLGLENSAVHCGALALGFDDRNSPIRLLSFPVVFACPTYSTVGPAIFAVPAALLKIASFRLTERLTCEIPLSIRLQLMPPSLLRKTPPELVSFWP